MQHWTKSGQLLSVIYPDSSIESWDHIGSPWAYLILPWRYISLNKYIYIYIHNPILWEFLRYALRLHLLFSLFGDKSNTSMDMSGSGRIPPLPNVLVYLLSYNLVAAAGTERWLT